MATPAPVKLGPGELKIGETGTELDASCQVNNLKIAPTKDQGDSKTKLCGTVVPGAVDYSFALTGNVDQDVATDAGLSALCWANAGQEVGFTFTPSTEAGATATGTLILDPLDFGGDEYGEDMTSDIEFAIVGKPDIVWGTAIPGDLAADSDVDEGQPELVGG